MNFLQKHKPYRNVRASINSVGSIHGVSSDQYCIIEDDKSIVCTHLNPFFYFEGSSLSYMHITDFNSKKTELINGRFVRIMFNLLEKKNRKQVKSR